MSATVPPSIVCGEAPDGTPIASVLVGQRYSVRRGRCQLEGNVALHDTLTYYDAADIDHRGYTRPSLLQRDLDLYAWRTFTDVVIQGDIVAPAPCRSLDVTLSCEGPTTGWRHHITVSGDRHVEAGPNGARLSEPAMFDTMPLRYDKAYGGTDERAELARYGTERRKAYRRCIDEDEAREWGEFSYPRNPAGKGYVVREQSAVGTPWPNLELTAERLAVSRLVAPHKRWGQRPLPAAFDWFPHAWFPRSRDVAPLPETEGGLPPERELEMGMLANFDADAPILARGPHSVTQGAHPLLSRARLRGTERFLFSHMASNGDDFEARLDATPPKMTLGILGAAPTELPALLDLVLLEPAKQAVTLLWRGTMFGRPEYLPVDWLDRTICTVS